MGCSDVGVPTTVEASRVDSGSSCSPSGADDGSPSEQGVVGVIASEKNTFLSFTPIGSASVLGWKRSRSAPPATSRASLVEETQADAGMGGEGAGSRYFFDAFRAQQLEILNAIIAGGKVESDLFPHDSTPSPTAAVHEEKCMPTSKSPDIAAMATSTSLMEPEMFLSPSPFYIDNVAPSSVADSNGIGYGNSQVSISDESSPTDCVGDAGRGIFFNSNDPDMRHDGPSGGTGGADRMLTASGPQSEGKAGRGVVRDGLALRRPPRETTSAKLLMQISKVPHEVDGGGPTSVGSALHSAKKCKPCAFLRSEQGCKMGIACRFCHFRSGHPEFIKVRFSKHKRSRFGKVFAVSSQ